jgi:hypothetical protein
MKSTDMTLAPSSPDRPRRRLLLNRRKNKRLRALIEDFRDQVQQNRRDLDLQFTRLAQLQAEVDLLKIASVNPNGGARNGQSQ